MREITACTNLVAHPDPKARYTTRLVQATLSLIPILLGYDVFLFASLICDIAPLRIVIT